MKKLLMGMAMLPFLAGSALAQEPMQLSQTQMDKVTAGWDLLETEVGNTSITTVSIYQKTTNTLACSSCYLLINGPAISVASLMKSAP